MVEPQVDQTAPKDLGRWRKPALIAALILAAIGPALFIITYFRYARLTDAKLRDGVFADTSDIYAANPPELLMNVSDHTRESRKIVRFDEIPKVLVDAVITVEDKRFFHHNGFDPLRMAKAAYVDLKNMRKNQGASTLSMQLARNLLLQREKSWTRKFDEIAIAMRLEEKLSKQQIFEYYCNQVYLGRRGTFSLHGFGAAAEAYFGKEIRDLNLPEAALLAGLIQRPSYYRPWSNSDRLRQRRDLVLALMRKNGVIGDGEYFHAVSAPVTIARQKTSQSDGAPYFVDLVNDEAQDLAPDNDARTEKLQIYTTLDLQLQQAASEAVRLGMENVDRQLKNRRTQVALVALDPHTGEVKALVGGRNYNESQLNRALAQRQPGSVFKPFVYTAALNTAIIGTPDPITPATVLDDEPTTFWSGRTPYEPGNFHHASYGEVTVREALAKSINIPTVKLAQMVGYGTVARLAQQAGLEGMGATPSIALGSYEARPLDVAGAYTIFANNGVYVKPTVISRITSASGAQRYLHTPETRPVLDPRVGYLMVNLLQGVMTSGTAAGARSRGFLVPAAGKTGTSRDGWFAGFTSQLLCVVWVGYDDNSDLKLEGAKSALPIWTEFMKRALLLSAYRDAKPFPAPRGVSTVSIDPESGALAGPNCPNSRVEFFISGTEPTETCPLHDHNVVVLPATLSTSQ